MSEKYPAKVDVTVLLLFFNRPETFKQVFEQVKLARPSKLLLYQDGPRGEKDMSGVEECRRIAENIDWECEVHRNYQEKNYGCDPSGYMSHKWAFSIADKCIVLEDDMLPSLSYFQFCKELLDKYENDERITLITGCNVEGITKDCPYDYFFSSVFFHWGWASWRRVVDKWDGEYKFLEDKYAMKMISNVIKYRGYRNNMLKEFYNHQNTGKQYFETIFQAAMFLNNGLCIVPRKNMVGNIGFSGEGTHTAKLELMPSKFRQIFIQDTYEIEHPLKHPEYIIEDIEYKETLYKIEAWNHPWIKIRYSLEELWLSLKVGDFDNITKSLRRRVNKWLGKDKHK